MIIGKCTYSNYIGIVARYADGHRFCATVSCGNYHYNVICPGLHDRLVERVKPVRNFCVRYQREVHHPDVVLILVINHPLDAQNDVLIIAVSELIQDPYANPIPSATQTQTPSQIFLSVPACCQRATLSRKLILRRGRARRGLPGRFIEIRPPYQEIT